MEKNTDLGLLIMRLSTGIMMLLHGIAKLLGGIAPIQSMVADKGLPVFISYAVFVGEIIAPILLIIGYRTRLSALVFALNCLAIMWFGGYSIFSLDRFGGWAAELPGLYLFAAITLFFTGAGKYALSNNNRWD